METVVQIEKRREEILAEMRGIRSMERGSINEQYLRVPQKGKKEPVLRGPYYVISRREGDKTRGYRLKTEAELGRARRDVEAHRRFRELCREYEGLTEELGRRERSMDEGSPKKKPQRSRSRRTKK
jgi:hypothetical protein